jgi:RNA polymerase sigma-70 factor, ECF subfamily
VAASAVDAAASANAASFDDMPARTTARPVPEETFLEHRPMLVSLAYRLLGSVHDAEDVAQDAYLRWAAEPRDDVANPAAFLTTITTRLALDRLRSAQSRHEVYVGPFLPEPLPTFRAGGAGAADGPAESAALRETATIGMLLLMEKLTPAERAVFVLREAFDVPYPQIAEILERTEASCRQLHRRAKQHSAEERPRARTAVAVDAERGRELAESFLAAARGGNLQGLMDLFREDVVLVTDGGGRVNAALRPVLGAEKVARLYAKVFTGKLAQADATYTEFNNVPGLLVVRPHVTFAYLFETDDDGRVTRLYGIANPEKLTHLRGTG